MDYNDYIVNILFYIFKNDEIGKKIRERIIDNMNIIIDLSFNLQETIESNDKKNNMNVIIYEKQSIKEILKKLPKYKKIKNIETTEDCSICLQKYTENTFKRTLECTHHFHKKCIDKWLKQCDEDNIHCPICRKKYEIKVSEIYKFNIADSDFFYQTETE